MANYLINLITSPISYYPFMITLASFMLFFIILKVFKIKFKKGEIKSTVKFLLGISFIMFSVLHFINAVLPEFLM